MLDDRSRDESSAGYRRGVGCISYGMQFEWEEMLDAKFLLVSSRSDLVVKGLPEEFSDVGRS